MSGSAESPESGAAPVDDPMAAPLAADELAKLRQQAQQAQTHWDQLLRVQAEYDNARKRMRKEQLELEQRVSERLLVDCVGLMDDFERALAAAEGDTNPQHLRTGIELIYRRMHDFLKAHGVEPIEAKGQPFDPARHEAVAHVTTTEWPEATVVDELRKGYTLYGRVIRPTSVKVAVRTTSEDASQGGT